MQLQDCCLTAGIENGCAELLSVRYAGRNGIPRILAIIHERLPKITCIAYRLFAEFGDAKRGEELLLFGVADKVAGSSKRRGEKQVKFVKHRGYLQNTEEGEWKYRIKGAFPLIRGSVSSDDSPLKFQGPLS
jgi:hypothetical protein